MAKDALGEAFPGYNAYAIKLKSKAYRHIVNLPEGRFVKYRTHDGRLFHVEVKRKTNRQGEEYDTFKLGEITSSQLISAEALAMKLAANEILQYLRNNRNKGFKVNSFTHDDISGEDTSENKEFVKYAYSRIAHHFNLCVPTEGGMPLGEKHALKSTISNYSEK